MSASPNARGTTSAQEGGSAEGGQPSAGSGVSQKSLFSYESSLILGKSVKTGGASPPQGFGRSVCAGGPAARTNTSPEKTGAGRLCPTFAKFGMTHNFAKALACKAPDLDAPLDFC